MIKVVLCNGKPGVGKTLLQDKCCTLCESSDFRLNEDRQTDIDSYSSVDFVKEIATECGWDGTKTPKNRKFLSDLKDLLIEWNDVPYQKILERIALLESFGFAKRDWILFVDCREPAEIRKLKKRLNATTLLMRRESVENDETSNHADAEVFYFDYDYVILNNGSVSDLNVEARKFLEYMKERPSYEKGE